MVKRLISEGLTTDGSFQLANYLSKVNDRLGQIGKHGKRAKLKQAGKSVVLQFSYQGKQRQWGVNCSFTKPGIDEAEKIAELVTTQLVANQFTPEWLDGLLGRDTEAKEKEKAKSCRELIEEYKRFYLRENKDLRYAEGSFYGRFNHIEKIMSNEDKPLSEAIVKQIIEKTENNTSTRTYTLQALTNLLEYYGIEDYNKIIQVFKSKNKPKKKKRNTPSDGQIINTYNYGFKPHPKCRKDHLDRYPQWQFLFGLLATYGLRIHEAWHIANWDNPVTLKKGDWVVAVEAEGEDGDKLEQYQGEDVIIPAILDPDNKDKILCIKHNTKTGYRMAMPISPKGHDWLKEFNLIGNLNLPDIKDATKRTKHSKGYACTQVTCQWFKKKQYGFTPHDLRHAYNHRAHQLGLNPTVIARSMGHSLQMNSTTYLKSMAESRNLGMMKEAIRNEKEKQNEVDILKAENKALKTEIERLRAEIQMLKALMESGKLPG